jgi:hypothetical protein
MSAVIRSISQSSEYIPSLPGNVFNLILISDVLSHIKHLIIMAHENKTFSIKSYVGIENDNRMHWLEETFYSQDDVISIAHSLLNQHEQRNPFSSEELSSIKNEIDSFNFDDNPALSVLFPSV